MNEPTKDVYNIDDLMVIFDCSKTTASKIKREIKSASDITHNNRVVHRLDYEIWLAKCKYYAERGLI